MHRPLPKSQRELLQRLVGFDSVNAATSGNLEAEKPLAEYLEFVAQAMGFTTRRLAVTGPDGRDRGFNLLASHEAAPGQPWLLFDSHLDTVGAQGMTVPPFAAEIHGDRLFGRGACDTKASGAAMLWALNLYAQSPSRPNNIAIAYTIDEEFGMSGVRTLIARLGDLDFDPIAVVVGEPTLLRPVIVHNGAVRLRISTRGQAAHSARPHLGRNAITMMAAVIDHLERQYIAKVTSCHPLTGPAAASITVIRGGTQVNVIPDRCSIDLDRRLIPGETAEDAPAALASCLRELQSHRPDIELDAVELISSCPPLSSDTNGDVLVVVQAALEAAGLPADPQGVSFATHAGNWAQTGLPAIVLGPGDAAQAHTADEWISLEQLELAVRAYLALMRTPLADLR